jgi:hypothetical protein
MSIETEMSTDVNWLKAKIAQLETEAKSVWVHYETYLIMAGSLIAGFIFGRLV